MACAVKKIMFSLNCWRTANIRLLQSQKALHPLRGVTRQVRLRGLRQYSTAGAAGMQLLSCVQEEVGLEQCLTEQLPEVTGFGTAVNGCIATLHRQHGRDKVVVELDTHNAVEVMPEELGEEGQEEGEPLFVPAFTVTITNSSGSRLQVDCSFDAHGQYVEQGNEWDNLAIDSVSVAPSNSQDTDSVYTVSADNLSTDLYESLMSYLQEKGIDQRFAIDVIQFYRVHEHRCYVEHSLKALRNFLTDQ